jgi:hypothetical protein
MPGDSGQRSEGAEMGSTYTPTLPKLGGFEYKPSLTPEQMAVTVLRSLRGKSISGEFFQDALHVIASLADEHSKQWPQFEMGPALTAVDLAACAFEDIKPPAELAQVLHQERADAARLGGVL